MTNVISTLDQEFLPLPYYPWEERPNTLAIDDDEAATAIHLSWGDIKAASALLKVAPHRLMRLVKRSPKLQRIQDESYDLAIIAAVSVPIQTLMDPEADNRRKEWASTKILSTRHAQGHPMSPAPAQPNSVAITQENRSFTVIWGDGTKIAELGPGGSEPVPEA
jgi:hypothetical protein